MTAVFPCFRAPLFTANSMADRESSSENNTRSRSVQDFVRTILHAVTNLQTQSGNPIRPENSSSAKFSSTDEEINARFQILRQSSDRRRIPNRSATPTRVVPSTAGIIRDRTTAQCEGTSSGAPLCALCVQFIPEGKREKPNASFVIRNAKKDEKY